MASRAWSRRWYLLIQPGRVEVADERTRAEEGGLVALAFFFGKRHHLDAEGQALASAVQLAHAGQGHENAQPPSYLPPLRTVS